MRPFLLTLVVLALGATATEVTLDELLCATNITANGVNVPDETASLPLILADKQSTTLLFELTDASLAAQVFVSVVVSTATFTPYDWTGGQTGTSLTLVEAEANDAVTVKPGSLADCPNTLGCDGLELDVIALRKLFAPNTTYVLFICQLQFASNGSITQMDAFHLLGAMLPQASTTDLGTSSPVTTNITFASTITPTGAAASAASSCKMDWSCGYIALTVGLSMLGIIMIACLRWFWTSPRMMGDQPLKEGGQEFGTRGYYGARYGGNSQGSQFTRHRFHTAKRTSV